MKRFFGILASVLVVMAFCCALVGCGGSSDSATEEEESALSGEMTATIQVEGYDPIVVNLDPENAPISCERFVTLAREGYYDGKRFYRVVPGFCLQGGTINDSASGDDPELETIVGEFTENNQANKLSDDFRRGSIAMARTNDPNSAKSTFFITLATSVNVSESLNGKYAAFGKVTADGMKVVDQIVKNCSSYIDPQSGTISEISEMPVIQSITIQE